MTSELTNRLFAMKANEYIDKVKAQRDLAQKENIILGNALQAILTRIAGLNGNLAKDIRLIANNAFDPSEYRETDDK